MYVAMIFLHILGAALWIGGSFLFLFLVIPQAKKTGDSSMYEQSVSRFSKLGFSALIAQLLTGVHLGMVRLPGFGNWFGFSHPYSHMIVSKLLLIVLSLGILFWITKVSKGESSKSGSNVKWVPWLILNLLGVLMLLTGVLFRSVS